MVKFSLRKEKVATVARISPDYTLYLAAALLIAQEYHAILRIEDSRLVIWGDLPNQAIKVLQANEQTVLRLIRQSHVSVCSSPMLHKHSWAYVVRRDCCQLCASLNYWIDVVGMERCA